MISEEPKKVNKFVTRYEQIYQRLNKVTTIYLKYKNANNFEGFITSERGVNKTGLNNMLIEIPEGNIIDILKEQYISEPNNVGEIGTIEPKNQAYEIRNIALLMLMSNRLSKEYKNRLEKNKQLDEDTKAKYSKNERDLLVWKTNATSDLIASLYVLKKTGGEEYSDFFSYGERKDDNNKDTFVIDLPYMGQISVHFGPGKNNVIEEAKNKAMSILERKRALGQIDKKELKQLREELSVNKILPKYTGRLFEYTSTLPIEYIGSFAKEKISEVGLDQKSQKDIETKDIKAMQISGLNAREAYYLAIKLGFSKKQLEEVIKVYGERKISNEEKFGHGAIRMTTADERAKVLQFEKRNLQNYRDEKDKKAIGG